LKSLYIIAFNYVAYISKRKQEQDRDRNKA
jgi:hypothetical protein